MKKFVQKGTGGLLAALFLILTIQAVQARRFFKVDGKNYVDIAQPCRDGITFRIARDNVGEEEMDWVRTESGITLVPGETLQLVDGPIQIPDGPLLDFSGTITRTYSQAVEPGTRIYIRLQETNAVNIYSTVRDCTLANPDSDPLTTITPGWAGWSAVQVNPGGTITSTITVPITDTIGDLNLALFMEGPSNTSDPLIISAYLQSPTGTRVQVMDSWRDNRFTEGTHRFGSNQCWGGNSDLVGDPKADFNLDDESFFAYSDIDSNDRTGRFTAFRPHSPLSAFDRETPTGDWHLVIENESTTFANLWCFFVELAPDESNKLYLPSILRNVDFSQKSVKITDITISSNQYHASFVTTGYIPQHPGEHIHFYFNTISEGNAGLPGSGPWAVYGGTSPFTQYGPANAGSATELCAVVANSDHTIQSGSGNCYPLP